MLDEVRTMDKRLKRASGNGTLVGTRLLAQPEGGSHWRVGQVDRPPSSFLGWGLHVEQLIYSNCLTVLDSQVSKSGGFALWLIPTQL